MQNKNNICLCGHRFAHHLDEKDNVVILREYGNSWCEKCTPTRSDIKPFHSFKLDNLRYLEDKYEKSLK